MKIGIKNSIHLIFSACILWISPLLYGQGLPTSGDAKVLIIYSEIKDSTQFDFNPLDLSNKLHDFYYEMSLGKLNLDITNLRIDIEEPKKLHTYKEAIVYLLEEAEKRLDLKDYSQYSDKSILDGICIVIDDFYSGWKRNPPWSGIAIIDLENQVRTFDDLYIQNTMINGESSGVVMRAPNSLNYSFWVLAHEVGHLFGLSHFPERQQYPYYQLMNPTGDYWGINRGMSFWEREKLGWIKPEIDIYLDNNISNKDSVTLILNDYMKTGEYAKINLPGNELYNNGEIISREGDSFYLENRTKKSVYDQDENKGDEGIFIWESPGELIPADGILDFSYYPTNDAFGAPNFTSTKHSFEFKYHKIDYLVPDEGHYKINYKMPVDLTFSNENKITISWGPVVEESRNFIITAEDISYRALLHDNYPNPFNPTTRISFRLYKWSKVTLEVFNMIGERMALLEDRFLQSGEYTYTYDASNTASGTYLYLITIPTGTLSDPSTEVHSGKMLYIK